MESLTPEQVAENNAVSQLLSQLDRLTEEQCTIERALIRVLREKHECKVRLARFEMSSHRTRPQGGALRGSALDDMVAAMRHLDGDAFDAKTLAHALGTTHHTMMQRLSRAARQGLVERVGHGMYRVK